LKPITHRFRKWPVVLALGLFYFGQLHTFVHVHHSHEHDPLPVEFSFHPLDIEIVDLPSHHDGDEHHHEHDTEHAKWLLSRGKHPRLALSQPPAFAIEFVEFAPFYPLGGYLPISRSPTTIGQSIRFLSDPRSPPMNV